jgi:hypothetical protein
MATASVSSSAGQVPAAASPSVSADEILSRVTRAIDALVDASAPYGGLFPSFLDRRTGAMLDELPPPIPGQRIGDRSFPGNNLMHDLPLLGTMYGLAAVSDEGYAAYATAADRYLAEWAATCTESATGLFPWGEHAFWDLRARRIGNSYALRGPESSTSTTHDHLRQAPVWFWEKLWRLNPRAVERFAEGLEYHWKRDEHGKPVEYIRHAAVEERRYPKWGPRACDFPRHSGFYLLDLVCAYLRTRRADFLTHAHRAAGRLLVGEA